MELLQNCCGYRGKKTVEEVDEAGGLISFERCDSLKESRKGKMTQNIQVPLKKTVTEEENVEFLKNLKVPDYSIGTIEEDACTDFTIVSTFALRRTSSCVE